ncbi:serine/threonine-protein kinase LMTK1 isoform X2 [Scleropages formosus]|uniref:non-specific serine/threonine protein kinase n=1 Tax=Scleropages formosus TaxID=113540 RepID=A0A8C9V9Y2_SCLFO|nr:serine/threonine-protein kinase LMTK1 isoform X2 [Scleropages formosus]
MPGVFCAPSPSGARRSGKIMRATAAPAPALALGLALMSSWLVSPGFAFSSQLDSDGAPLSELSWSSSLAVVAVSFSGLFTFVFLMLACLCCKKGDIGFKEFKNVESEDYQGDFSTLGSPASQSGPEVYILPLTEVSLPVSKQPGRSIQLLKSNDLGRHSLLYLKEIGHGWFGKVLLGEVNAGLSTMQVVVKELKASASVQDQMQFLEEVQPFRALQHPALLQCLAQCTEVTPYLLVMEFCHLGDLKGYLRSCRAAESVTPEPLILQRMACDIASGLVHLHKHSYVHSDLALRNCLLTSEVTVKIGDYGLSHNKYKDDYFVTSDQLWIPLRWIAPEIVDEVHGNLLVVDQTKPSNVWSLGVTIWELFELGNQPYRLYSDRQVLTYAVKEQQLKLPKPLLKVPLSDRWYEVMQFCWLQPDQRPTAEEVHLLLSYLCAKGASEEEEDFEKRWNSMRPNNSHSSSVPAAGIPPSSSSSFPLLERFSTGDGYQPEPGDDVLTVTETSRGLNFEYKWEQARHEEPYHSSSTSGPLGQGNPHYQDIYYPSVNGCGVDGLTLGVSPSYYESKQLHAPGVVPVLSAHSPSVGSEYYIRIEEPVDCHLDLDYTMCPYSPGFEGGSDGNFVVGSGNPTGCVSCPPEAHPGSYWSADMHKGGAYDSDNSPAVSLIMEPLLGQVCSPMQPWESSHYISYKDRDGGYYYEPSPSIGVEHYLMEDHAEPLQESWGSRSLRQALGELENPLGISPSLGDPRQGYDDPCMAGECYYDMMGSLRKTMPGAHTVNISIEREGNLFGGQQDSDLDEDDLFAERESRTWASNHSANNNSLNFDRRPVSCGQDTYVDYHYTLPSTDVEDLWPQMGIKENAAFRSDNPLGYPEAMPKDNAYHTFSKHHALISSRECNTCIYLCHEGREDIISPVKCHQGVSVPQFVDPLAGAVVRNYTINDYVRGKKIEPNVAKDEDPPTSSIPHVQENLFSKPQPSDTVTNPVPEHQPETTSDCKIPVKKSNHEQEASRGEDTKLMTQSIHVTLGKPTPSDAILEGSQALDSGVEKDCSNVSLVDISDCSDDDITDVTSGIFTDITVDCAETVDSPATRKTLQKQVGTPDSIESIDLPSTSDSCEVFNTVSFHTSPPKALDSGYDTENNESPEFMLKEPYEHRNPDLSIQPSKTTGCMSPEMGDTTEKAILSADADLDTISLLTSHNIEVDLTSLSEKNPYRDSAYFSDYDADNERFSRDEGDDSLDKLEGEDFVEREAEKEAQAKPSEQEDLSPPHLQIDEGDSSACPDESRDINADTKNMSPRGELSEADVSSSSSAPVLSTLSPSPPEMGGCLTKESSQDEGLGLDSEHSGEEPSSECSSSTVSVESSSQQEPSTLGNSGKEPEGTDSLAEPLVSDSTSLDSNTDTLFEIRDEEPKKKEDPQDPVNLQEKSKEEQDDSSSATLSEGQGAKERDMEDEEPLETAVTTKSSCPSSPPPPLPSMEGRVSPADGEEADSEDSEESDEELRCYNIQEQSEESEEESPTVPVVVSDRSNAQHLRSLLKMPSLLSESFCEELDRKKKAVSFFDDVTVYLFDQESPTRELAEHGFPPGAESCGRGSGAVEPCPQDRVNTSDDSSDGNISEESGGFEWEDDFPLLPSASSMTTCSSEPQRAPSQPPTPPELKPAAQFSRFTVSPSNVSRFSITHVSDSDMDSVGGSSEDGERE